MNPSPDFPFTQDNPLGTEIQLQENRVGAVNAHPAIAFRQGSPATKVLWHEDGLILDFGSEVVGYVHAAFNPWTTVTVRFYYGETPNEVMRTSPYTSNWYTLPMDEWELKKGPNIISTPGRRAFRYLRIAHSNPALVPNIDDIYIKTQSYPLANRGSFASSNSRLNDVWDISKRTTGLCMQMFYEDGIKRDGLLWIGDYRIQFLCNTGPFGDQELARRSLLMIAASQQKDGALPACAARGGGHRHPHDIAYMPGIPFGGVDRWVILNYCADFPCAVYEYHLYTGDTALVRKLADCLRRLLHFMTTPLEPGDEPPYLNVDALSHFADNGIDLQSRICIYAQLFMGFQRYLDLAVILDDIDMSITARHAIAGIRERFDDLIDPQVNRLKDVTNARHRESPGSWHAASMAALSGIFPADLSPSLLSRTMADPAMIPTANGYSEFFLLQALFDNGMGQEAIAEILNYWGPMLEFELTTCPEFNRRSISDYEFGEQIGGGAAMSFCHGWSGGPAYLLPAYVLGIRPRTAGFATVTIAPSLGTLDWAEGTIPTPQGPITVRWERHGAQIKGTVDLPDGVTGIVLSPKRGSILERTIQPGRHQVTIPAA